MASAAASATSEKVVELSFEETNALRASLGLKPLRRTPKTTFVAAPLPPSSSTVQAQLQSEKQALQHQVQHGGTVQFGTDTLASSSGKRTSNKEWAQQMKTQQQQQHVVDSTTQEYGEADLKGLAVGHSVADLAEGSTTVLTLTDTPLLQTSHDKKVTLHDADSEQVLQNVNLAQTQGQSGGLLQKRQAELGQGRANGYTGWDDDEFAELGGSQAPSQMARTTAGDSRKGNTKGFTIGSHLVANEEDEDDETTSNGTRKTIKAISLEPSQADVTANDFMTVEEEQATRRKDKFKKQKKKKKKRRTKSRVESDDEETNLLDLLEETAVEATPKKRRRDKDHSVVAPVVSSSSSSQPPQPKVDSKRSRYDQVMAKGNQRSQQAFGGNTQQQQHQFKSTMDGGDDQEPDDAFLNAALAKARRVNRLKEMKKGAQAVLGAVQEQQPDTTVSSNNNNTITFAVDETREFTRALQARSEQVARKKKTTVKEMEVETVSAEEEEQLDINELAKNIKDDTTAAADLDGTTGSTVTIGRGVGSVLHLLEQTGDLLNKNAGKELLRGRAKDERTYDDYEPLDLQTVVQLDPSTATQKDKEMAARQVKLEYRDRHGRLLTRKEAYRELCYQFHGHGSGKRKEEKKLEQIAREQAEASMASRDGAGTFGALQAAQKASGKAFIVHKSGKN